MTIQATTTYAMIVGWLISKWRRERGIKQAELAQFAGLSQSSWSKIERGAVVLSIEHVARVAERFGLRPGELLSEADRVVDRAAAVGIRVIGQRVEPGSAEAMSLIGPHALGALAGSGSSIEGRAQVGTEPRANPIDDDSDPT